MKKDAFYFPHFCNARHDRKIKRLRKELGVEGYGIFFMLLETLRDQIDFKYPIQDIDLLAEEFNTSEQKVRVVICNYQLFEIDNEEQFFSPKLILYLQPYLAMKEQRRLAGIESGKKRKEKAEQKLLNGCSTGVQRKLNENEQSKVKKSKEKESKENIYNAFFESVWSLYPNKKGKAQVSKKSKEAIYKLGYDKLKLCIDRYKKSKPDWQQWQNGSTFFNGGYEDYLDNNYEEPKEEYENPYRLVE